MSKLIVDYTPILEINEHPNADKLELAKIKGWQVVVKKGQFKVGDKIIYLPPDSVLPQHIHEHLGITNYLAELPKGYRGFAENERPTARRVKAARLRGQASYGTVMTPVDATIVAGLSETPNFTGWDKVEDIATELGITKWEPPIKSTQGDVDKDIVTFHKYTDIENWRNYPDIIKEGEQVVVTEKIHGTNCRLGNIKDPSTGSDTRFFVAGSHNTRRKEVDTNGKKCLYWEPFDWNPGLKRLLEDSAMFGSDVIIFGEIFGSSVQDMNYGLTNGQKSFRVFDISINGKYLDHQTMVDICEIYRVGTVPVLYTGPFSSAKIEELTDGTSTFDVQTGFRGREGVVIKPLVEREDPIIGRVILKSISADYLARKGGTDGH